MKNKLTYREAWLEIQKDLECPCRDLRRFVRFGLCNAVRVLFARELISRTVYFRMCKDIKTSELRQHSGMYWFPLTIVGDGLRSEWIAALLKKEAK